MIRISKQKQVINKEPLSSPFGFKGAYLTELWQSIVRLESVSGASGIGLGVQSILWSDANLFVRYGEQRGNELMNQLTSFALEQLEQVQFEHPIELMDRLIQPTYQHGQRLTSDDDLRLTFALNSLVSMDHALWSLYAQEQSETSFIQLIPEDYSASLSSRHEILASIPLIPYGMSDTGITQLLEEGYFLLKIKIGADPDQDGDQEKMLAWDQRRLSEIHEIAKRYETSYTDNGKIAYYLDANGRYESKDTLLRFLEHAERIGALERILLFEEPFDEKHHVDVSDVPVVLTADESVHSIEDAIERIDMGFRAMALKPIAKTMSLSLKIAKLAHEKGISCFCADLTVNPMMVDWNKNLAGCLAPLPGLKVGAIETNGHQNYSNWEQMKSYHPSDGAPWTHSTSGIYTLNEEFYRTSGGALTASEYYSKQLED